MSDPLPLFPLHLVLFPGMVLPLHVFEDRYRTLVRDLAQLPVDASREFGVVAIKVGYEVGERGVHTIQRTGCSALATNVSANEDGTFELTAVGRRRFHVERLDSSQDYLRADVTWLPDPPGGQFPSELGKVTAIARDVFSVYRDTIENLRGDDVLDGVAPADSAELSYALAAALVLNLAERQALLEAPDVLSRLRLCTSMMRSELRAISAIRSLPATSMARTAWSPN